MFAPVASLRLPITESSQVGDARRQASRLAEKIGFGEQATSDLAIIVTELASNLVKHTPEGELLIREVTDGDCCTIEVLSLDRGAGMRSLEESLRDGFSTAGTRGAGLGAVRRLASVWDVYSQSGQGTVQVARLSQPRDRAQQKPTLAGLSVPARGETVCGDAWTAHLEPQRMVILGVDGLGHGPLAARAAHEAVRVFQSYYQNSPSEILEAMRRPLHATRGAAVAVTELDLSQQQAHFAGVGNLAAFLFDGESTQRMVSMNGTVGVEPCRIRQFSYSLPDRGLLVIHSDGLSSQTGLSGYQGIAVRDPAVIAGVLYRDFVRGRDDATVVVARLGEE